mmetsp:Transcript_52234/g.146609  ORF Transcript_52234/g.146609 Transcript_52234/m.146609 type:complete len:203 (+) Transcript_52234:101-709(+)
MSSRLSRSRPAWAAQASTPSRIKSMRELSKILGFTHVTITSPSTSSICPRMRFAHMACITKTSTSLGPTLQWSAISEKVSRRCFFGLRKASSISASAHILGLSTVCSACLSSAAASIFARCFVQAPSKRSNLPSPKACSKSLTHSYSDPSNADNKSCWSSSPKLNSSGATSAAQPISKARRGRSSAGIDGSGVNDKYEIELL